MTLLAALATCAALLALAWAVGLRRRVARQQRIIFGQGVRLHAADEDIRRLRHERDILIRQLELCRRDKGELVEIAAGAALLARPVIDGESGL